MKQPPVLIDGAWFIRALTSIRSRERMHVDIHTLLERLAHMEHDLGVIFWFDASRLDRPLHDFHRELMSHPDVSLFLGTLRSNGVTWTQKQVDSMIVVRLHELAMAGHDDIILIAGDEDLVPGVRAAQRWGSRVHLWSIKDRDRSSSPADSTLAAACDSLWLIDDELLRPCITPVQPPAVQAMARVASA